MDISTIDREVTVALALVGDAELTLFVREALLHEGLRDTMYFQEFTSRAAHREMYAQLTGSRLDPKTASELLEAAYASDRGFRDLVNRMVVRHIRARTSPRTGSRWEVAVNPSGRIVTMSCFDRYGDRVPPFISPVETLAGVKVERREGGRVFGRLIGFCIEYTTLVLDKLMS